MKVVLEAMSSSEEAGEQEAALLSLERLGFLRSSQRLANGAWLIEVDHALMAELFEATSLFRSIKLSTLQ